MGKDRRAKASFSKDDGKVAPLKLRISSRKRKQDEDDDPDSDHEFETLLKQHERQLDQEEKEKEERRQSKRAAVLAKKKKVEEEEAEEHQNYCEVCQGGGELMLCDTCTRSYHLVCFDADATEVPEGDWSCPHCETNGVPQKEPEEQKRGNMDVCRTCREGGFLLCCDTCPNSFHAFCLEPPLNELPPSDENWSCPHCTAPEPKYKPEKYISWRWKYVEYPDPVAEEDLPKEGEDLDTIEPERNTRLMLRPLRKMEPRRERELYVKWKYLSYWHCEWMPEWVLEIYHMQSLRMYWRKQVDMENPPEVEDVPSEPTEKDPHCMEHRFYRYGIKPEWMQIHRVINHSQYSKTQYDYLIKWRELAYEQATWEGDDMEIPDFVDAIGKYWTHRERMTNESIPKAVVKRVNQYRMEKGLPTLEEEKKKRKEHKPHKADLRKKYEEQPDYITETGGKLHPYQLEGINWLRHGFSQKTNSILADEMGLGKTIQSTAFLYSLLKEGHSKGPFLIVAPLSTLINWEREAEFWAPDFYVVTYVGDKESRTVVREHEMSFREGAVRGGPKATRLRTEEGLKFHVLLTSYELINMDKAILSSIEWQAVVVDEAHRLKNNQSLFFRNLNDFNIRYRLLLTGTPLQNNLEELFYLLSFLSPDRFDNLETFTHEFADISKEEQIQKLHNLLGPHMLRRLKADVLTGMPSKSELIVRVDMSPMQKKYYRNILTRNYEALNVKSGGAQVSLVNIIMELKKCCNHPYLFAKASLEAPKLKSGIYEGTALVKASGKFILMQKMLRKLKEDGHRVLLFSQMTRVLDIIEDFCENEGYKYERIDGSVGGQVRQDAIDRFNAPDAQQFLFLLSTRAGGLGINLTSADTVVLFDSDWNPHADIQAFSRAHRLGQKNKVLIFRFVTRNSVEERIQSVAKKKMLLTHLVVRAGLGQKGPSMSKTELDDVLRWGTEELFKDEDPEKDEHAIHWDDDAVAALLDRGGNEEPQQSGEKKEHWTNEYLSSFKVAQYVTKEAEQEEEPEEEETVKEKPVEQADPEYWEKLLRHHYEQDQEVEHQKLGKGKRVRRQVNYAAENMHADWAKQGVNRAEDDDEYRASLSGSESDESLAGSAEGGGTDSERGKKRDRFSRLDRPDEKLPPLLTRVNGQIEVLGFNPRQRRAFYNAVMRFGMPAPDGYRSQWLVRDLRTKSEKAFRAYSSLFMRHLCEPGADRDDHFNDGVPREGLNRHNVLARIGTMALIRRKVQEYEKENGEWSMPEVRDKQVNEQLIALGLIGQGSRDPSQSKEGSLLKDGEMEKEQSSAESKQEATTNSNPPSNKPEEKKEEAVEEMDVIETASKEVDNGQAEENEQMEVDQQKPTEETKAPTPTENKAENGDEESMNARARSRVPPPFKFNVTEGGFTELHTIWKSEEDVVKARGLDYEIWHRRHDYWLLCAFVTHGYARYHDILNDPRFAILNEPFKSEEAKGNFQDVKNRFLQRRYKLLEQALIVEEQLRRAAHLNYGTKPPPPPVKEEQTAADAKLERAEDEKLTETEEKPNDQADAEKSTPEAVPASSSAPLATTAKPEQQTPIQQLNRRYVQIETLVDANQALAREAFGGNKQAAVVFQKVLTQLEEVLSDMKSDVSRLPTTVAQLPSVAERLEMAERIILNRLTTRDPEASAGVSPLPPPGAFVSSEMQTRFTGIQPKFAAIRAANAPIRTPTYGSPVVVSINNSAPTSKEAPALTAENKPPTSNETAVPASPPSDSADPVEKAAETDEKPAEEEKPTEEADKSSPPPASAESKEVSREAESTSPPTAIEAPKSVEPQTSSES